MDLILSLLGDSIAYGVGADRQGDRLGERLAAGLAGEGITAETWVVAVPGSRSAGLARQVDALLAQVRSTAPRPHVAVVVVGANDLTHQVPAEQAAADLADAVRRLRDSGAQVVVAPAPDLSVVPDVPASLRPVVRAGSVALRRAQERETRAAGGWLGDADGSTTQAFERDPSLFSGDRFHPSSAGYAVIAQALLPVVLDAAWARR